ncbi:AraC family transcriptional regulator [Lentibacter sp. XHP0401]|jgi:AraC-like DNA-binding protein|uniref:AraC family transcriptional regulator n=1 Tax=Lentibacter sp. XHP0401 TaxID=2984334 RepID=UPI0021E72A42|nr:AraC family transcriptional regulator [Lentibacter sp. XHP0401]MCV2893235.1 AraC family transcriptional regulator [Lentibacter sp. XHP0401]
MKHPQTYAIQEPLAYFSSLTGVSPARVLRRAGLPESFLSQPKTEVDAEHFFSIWSAATAEIDNHDAQLDFGTAFANKAFTPCHLAYSASATLRDGLTRLALFKPLVAPLSITLSDTAKGLQVRISPAQEGLTVPPDLARFELAYFLTTFRQSTGAAIIPLEIALPDLNGFSARERDFCGITPTAAPDLTISLSHEDAARPLLSANTALLKTLEPMLIRELATKPSSAPLGQRVHNILLEMLPAGEARLSEAASRLHMSPRSLQRGLTSEGLSFQILLKQARLKAAKTYLAHPDISTAEIAYLLAFRDTNSFFRAFQSWTGTTPNKARQNAL